MHKRFFCRIWSTVPLNFTMQPSYSPCPKRNIFSLKYAVRPIFSVCSGTALPSPSLNKKAAWKKWRNSKWNCARRESRQQYILTNSQSNHNELFTRQKSKGKGEEKAILTKLFSWQKSRLTLYSPLLQLNIFFWKEKFPTPKSILTWLMTPKSRANIALYPVAFFVGNLSLEETRHFLKTGIYYQCREYG